VLASLTGGLLFSAASATEAHAQTINVATVAELESAFARAGAGTTIVLANGTYRLTAPIYTILPGTKSARITVRAATANGAIIETNGAEEAFRIVQPYWSFLNLYVKVTNNSNYGYKLEGAGANTIITGGTIEIRPGSEAGIKGAGGMNAPWPDNARIEGMKIFMSAPTTYGLAEGIDAVAVRNWTIRANTVYGIRTSAGGVAYGIMTKGNSQNTVIERNLVYDCFIGLSLGGGGTGAQWVRNGDIAYEDRNGTVRNNVVMGSSDVALYLYKSNGSSVYNNTFYNSYTTCGTGCSSIDVRMSGATADIRNNILDKRINDRDGATHTAGSNLTLPTPSHTGWFVDAANKNMRLKAGAPAIDAGSPMTGVTTDRYNVSRPRGGAIDIGATEYVP
jgi:parallel beta-helix repeat protein